MGTLSVTPKVVVLGNRCGSVTYRWDGSNSSLNWTSSDWWVYLYPGGPGASPYDIGYSSIRNASGTAPWVSGIDDFPTFSGRVPVCGKKDGVRRLSVWGQWGDSYGPPVYEDEISVDYAVDYQPVAVKAKKRKRAVTARVIRNGRPWAGVSVQVKGLRGRTTTLRSNANGVVKIKRSATTRNRLVRFVLSDIAKSEQVRL